MHAGDLGIEGAVSRAVDECIREGILSDFLRANKAEVVAMSIFEYNEEAVHKVIRQQEREEGHIEGRKEGSTLLLITLVQKKLCKGKSMEQITGELEETEEQVRPIYDAIMACGIDAAPETVYEKLLSMH